MIGGNNVDGRFRLLLLLLMALIFGPLSARAQAPEHSEAFVYGINAALPEAVVGTFAPPIVDEIFLLADLTSILSPRRTSVYFWPISNEYRAAWSQKNEEVDGILEVMQGRELVATYEQMPYTIHFSSSDSNQKPHLYVGQEAVAANERFQAEQLSYRQATADYETARQEWLAVARAAQARGDNPSSIPPAPEKPEPMTTFSTGLNSGYPIELPEGNYQVRTRQADGTIIPESIRDLTVFMPRNTAVGYEVVPESRWTFPEELNDISGTILGEDNTVLFLKPKIVREYPALAYERLQNPQYVGDGGSSEWVWVSGETIDEGILELVLNENVKDRVSIEPYFVKQVPGKEYGYEILRYNPNTPDETPRVDFEGFRIELSSDLPAYEIRLRSINDELLLGSAREVRVIEPYALAVLLPVALLPLVLGAVIIVRRYQRTKRSRASTNSTDQ